jgi:type II restriction enzyme
LGEDFPRTQIRELLMAFQILTDGTIRRRTQWLEEIVQISGHFGNDSTRIEQELGQQIDQDGIEAILDHLRLAGAIPEHYGHDSSEEKLYSKYTDALLSAAFKYVGLTSIVLSERADVADVEAVAQDYALVADAKAFRLSRTAKNQKDFKVEAMHRWKWGKPHAMVVCPIYQLPVRSSQIYEQAIRQTVCIFTYSHLAVLVRLAESTSQPIAVEALHRILNATKPLNPSKEALPYWQQLNRTMLDCHPGVPLLWQQEKLANSEAIGASKEEAMVALASERQRVLQMSRSEAIQALIRDKNIDGRTGVVQAVSDNSILDLS